MARIQLQALTLALSALACAALVSRAHAQVAFTVSGTGGGIPPVGTGGTAGWPLGPPENFKFASGCTVAVPADAFRWTKLQIDGLNHTFVGDVHIVLRSPSGVKFNILSRPGFVGLPNPNSGNASDLLTGTYYFVESGAPQIPHVPDTAPESPIQPGYILQDFGNPNGGLWPAGTDNIYNVPLSEIPVVPGFWQLWIYDWNAFDTGSLTGWTLHGLRSPMPYCTAGISSSGCEPTISAAQNPSVSHANGCSVQIAQVNGQRSGLIFYGVDNSNWFPLVWASGSSSYLCVKPPTQRTPLQNTGGALNSCTGSLVLDWEAYQSNHPTALGAPWSVGEHVYVQGWYRDPSAPKGTHLSDAIELVYAP